MKLVLCVLLGNRVKGTCIWTSVCWPTTLCVHARMVLFENQQLPQLIWGQVGDEGALAPPVHVSVVDLLYFFLLHLKSSLYVYPQQMLGKCPLPRFSPKKLHQEGRRRAGLLHLGFSCQSLKSFHSAYPVSMEHRPVSQCGVREDPKRRQIEQPGHQLQGTGRPLSSPYSVVPQCSQDLAFMLSWRLALCLHSLGRTMPWVDR